MHSAEAIEKYEVIVIGAGAAGMFAAIETAKAGTSVLVLESNPQVGSKIKISGGGRCNFTNLNACSENYLSENPHFAKYALNTYTAIDFIKLVESYQIKYHEKKLGQLFCDHSSSEIIDMLLNECKKHKVKIQTKAAVNKIYLNPKVINREAKTKTILDQLKLNASSSDLNINGDSTNDLDTNIVNDSSEASKYIELNLKLSKATFSLININLAKKNYLVTTADKTYSASSLVIASGGLAIPQIGANDFGYQLARMLNLKVIEPLPALVPVHAKPQFLKFCQSLSGVSIFCKVTVFKPSITASDQASTANKPTKDQFNRKKYKNKHKQISFLENLLFTHRGLSGPAILQISSYLEPDDSLKLDLLPADDLLARLKDLHQNSNFNKKTLKTILKEPPEKSFTALPAAFIDHLTEQQLVSVDLNAKLAETSFKSLQKLADFIHSFRFEVLKSEGFKKAEVTVGGLDTNELQAKTMMTKNYQDLYFIGEVVDVTGWLGGYNFQWAWSSGYVAAQSVTNT
jgi:predicted flavoprotein YhiN